jgi:hypothetical protein
MRNGFGRNPSPKRNILTTRVEYMLPAEGVAEVVAREVPCQLLRGSGRGGFHYGHPVNSSNVSAFPGDSASLKKPAEVEDGQPSPIAPRH